MFNSSIKTFFCYSDVIFFLPFAFLNKDALVDFMTNAFSS